MKKLSIFAASAVIIMILGIIATIAYTSDLKTQNSLDSYQSGKSIDKGDPDRITEPTRVGVTNTPYIEYEIVLLNSELYSGFKLNVPSKWIKTESSNDGGVTIVFSDNNGTNLEFIQGNTDGGECHVAEENNFQLSSGLEYANESAIKIDNEIGSFVLVEKQITGARVSGILICGPSYLGDSEPDNLTTTIGTINATTNGAFDTKTRQEIVEIISSMSYMKKSN
ncbi:hypothetical protein KC909_04990 [Candidatus Dojkabacteria bacterium]|uniref:Uncharacterized protein n=1 Tax=Candidatus Dojkabacteria bacterium TaxID=2099670 RepID=A0A955RJQ0_9BACT|nr:hypothetical protein [Candidatus Dojkabacteria bacterium]